jgi:hypothetical protein
MLDQQNLQGLVVLRAACCVLRVAAVGCPADKIQQVGVRWSVIWLDVKLSH